MFSRKLIEQQGCHIPIRPRYIQIAVWFRTLNDGEVGLSSITVIPKIVWELDKTTGGSIRGCARSY